ncbi:MAG: pilus assembly protein HicB [Bacteroides sp.]|nr:pilus assembly protein HicB [Bacteroides sp.]
MKIKAVVEKNDNNFYAITCDDVIAGCHFGGYGYSVAEAKADFMEGIEESLEVAKEMGKDVTISPKDIEVEFRYDIPSFFNYFDWINISAFAKQAGINESKMRAYKSGLASASEKTLAKILSTIKDMGTAMSAVAL